MSKRETEALTCPACGHPITAGENICTRCNSDLSSRAAGGTGDGAEAWEREGERLKKLWVIVVVFFWFSVIFQATLYFLDGSLNFVLLSVIGGMMILGVVLKTRFQLHSRHKP